jgi:hypothetical protein
MALAIPLFLLCIVIVASGSPFIQKAQSNAWVSWFVNAVKFVGDKENWVLQQAIKLTKWVTHELGPIYQATFGRVLTWLATLNHYVYVVGYWSLYWPIALKHEVDHLRHKTIPTIVDRRTAPIRQTAQQAEAEARAAAGQAHSTVISPAKPGTVQKVTRIERVAMPHAHEWEWIHDHWKATKAAILGAAEAAIAIPIPGGIAWRNPLAALRRAHNARLRRLEKLVAVGGIAAILSQILGVSTRCLRGGGNVGKAARRICGLDTSLFNSFLLDLVAILSVVSVVEFANDLRAVEDEALAVMGRLVREWPS